MKVEPILAVNDVNASSDWYQNLLGLQRTHAGDHFSVLRDTAGNVMLCLHAWGRDDHPTMLDSTIPVGNGLILYFQLANLDATLDKIHQMEWPLAEELHRNPNSGRREFALRDPDGYYLTFTESHDFEG